MIKRLAELTQKKSIKNGMWMYLLQFFNTIIPLLPLPYITRVLGSTKYGVFSIALNLVMYMQVVVEYGFGMSATRKIALNDSSESINKTFSGVLFARVILFAICFVFSVIYAIVERDNPEQFLSLLILDICLLGYCVQVNWLFQGLQEMKFISLVNIVARTVSVILIFAFVKTPSDLLLYCFFYSVSPFLSGVIGCIIAVRRYKIKLFRPDKSRIWNELKDGWYVFTTQLSSKVFGAIGITFLGFFAIEREVGVYSAIQKITNVMILCWTPISQVLYPISSKKFQGDYFQGKMFVRKIRRFVLPVFSGIAILIGFFSQRIVTIAFGDEYAANFGNSDLTGKWSR